MSDIRVLLVDDQALVRSGFAAILHTEPGIEVVGEAVDGEQAVAQAVALEPDVVLMDVQMPVRDGLSATRDIVERTCAAVLVLTTFDRDDYLFEALEAGAAGFLVKNASPEDLVHAVQVVARGDALLAPDLTRRVVARLARAPGRAGIAGRGAMTTESLTDRESEVLALLAGGMSNAEIAARLVVGEATVKTHVSRVLTKLGLRDRVQAVVYAYETGLVVPARARQHR